MNRIIIVIFLAVVISSCARTIVTYREYMSNAIAPPQTNARFIVFRPLVTFGEKLQGGPREVKVKIDGKFADYLGGGFKTFDVSAGKHTISVGLWESFFYSNCQLDIDTVGGGEYYFQIVKWTPLSRQ